MLDYHFRAKKLKAWHLGNTLLKSSIKEIVKSFFHDILGRLGMSKMMCQLKEGSESSEVSLVGKILNIVVPAWTNK